MLVVLHWLLTNLIRGMESACKLFPVYHQHALCRLAAFSPFFSAPFWQSLASACSSHVLAKRTWIVVWYWYGTVIIRRFSDYVNAIVFIMRKVTVPVLTAFPLLLVEDSLLANKEINFWLKKYLSIWFSGILPSSLSTHINFLNFTRYNTVFRNPEDIWKEI